MRAILLEPAPNVRTYVVLLTDVRGCDTLRGTMAISSTRLRQNLYNILDQVIDTGVPVEIERKGHTLRIVPERRPPKWERLEPHKAVRGDPDDLVHVDWSSEWRG
jgi:hypothetical protein